MKLINTICICVLMLASPSALAVWSANAAYNNPPGAAIGLNLLHIWTDWAGEIGFGYYKDGKDDKDRSARILAGAINIKYFVLTGQSLRPYAQLGTGWGFSTTGNSTHFAFGEMLYGGAGLFVVGSGVYAFGSYNTGIGLPFIQAGLGLDL